METVESVVARRERRRAAGDTKTGNLLHLSHVAQLLAVRLQTPRGNELGRAVNVMRYGTPKARDWKGFGFDCDLPTQIGGSLNPPWVEWLMGWPIGWTDLKRPGTDRFRQWWRSLVTSDGGQVDS